MGRFSRVKDLEIYMTRVLGIRLKSNCKKTKLFKRLDRSAKKMRRQTAELAPRLIKKSA